MRRNALMAGAVIAAVLLCALTYVTYERSAAPSYIHDGNINAHEAIEYWKARIAEVGPAHAHDEMVEDGRGLARAHTISHAFGEALYRTGEREDIRFCGAGEYLFGCYHQFIGLTALESGLSGLWEIANDCGASIACAHGIGHGLLAAFDYTEDGLVQTLGECAHVYNDPGTRSACGDGAFMEYNLQEISQFNQGGPSDRMPRTFSEEDAVKPCEKTGEFQPECTYELPLWWSYALIERIPDISIRAPMLGGFCRTKIADPQLRKTCFLGLGFPISHRTNFSVPGIIAACGYAGSGIEKQLCLIGAGRRFADNGLPFETLCADFGFEGTDETLCKKLMTAPREEAIRFEE